MTSLMSLSLEAAGQLHHCRVQYLRPPWSLAPCLLPVFLPSWTRLFKHSTLEPALPGPLVILQASSYLTFSSGSLFRPPNLEIWVRLLSWRHSPCVVHLLLHLSPILVLIYLSLPQLGVIVCSIWRGLWLCRSCSVQANNRCKEVSGGREDGIWELSMSSLQLFCKY